MDTPQNSLEKQRKTPFPQITLIVPVYNGSRYLRDLLESVLCQSFENWICICVNDGSTDSSQTIIKEYIERDSRFKVTNKTNSGTGASRNVGLQQVQSKYVMFADQDDVLHHQCFEIAYTFIESSQADVLTYERTHFHEKYVQQPISTNDICIESLSNNPVDQFLTIQKSASICVWQRIYRHAAIQGVLFPEITGGEDSVFMMEIALRAPKWASINVSLYGVRDNDSSVSRSVPLWYIDNGFQAYHEIAQLPDKYAVDRDRIAALIHDAAFWFSLSIVLRCGSKPDATIAFSKVAAQIQRAEEQGVLQPNLTRSKALFFWMLKNKCFFPLRYFALLSAVAFSSRRLHHALYQLIFKTAKH